MKCIEELFESNIVMMYVFYFVLLEFIVIACHIPMLFLLLFTIDYKKIDNMIGWWSISVITNVSLLVFSIVVFLVVT